ncbi:hypothetical protein CRU94_02740 [Arcobacter sp. AHV-9/2010]|uniref:hypothetical protein n=1 Tax=Arcobacter sp. AHV-9/2010 TaxID=2021861 RepID=UPI00100BBE11|nr:hypothetical protein [Arcobacter sp. CECT 9299]RXJ97048.1 hypothetical protein CRU94_02740 [Arcobacter sp. CECT 9299]
MIINISKIKTEALLLFCRDLIDSYKDMKFDFGINKELEKQFLNINENIYKELNSVLKPSSYYIQNQNNFRIKAILKAYNYLNKQVSNRLKPNEKFNPSMLYFSLLALWFNELNKESRSKEYIFFILYPYSNIYDKFLINIDNLEYRNINIKMIELAEDTILKFDNFVV